MIGVDFGAYAPALTDAEVQSWNVEFAIVGNLANRKFQQQVQACQRNGLITEAYIYIYYDRDINKQITDCINACKQAGGIERIWLDVEIDTSPPPASQVLAAVHQMQAAVEANGFAAGIYTSRSMWATLTNNSKDFSDLPLWDACYDSEASFDYFIPYGGWTAPLIKQYAGNVTIGTTGVDMNYAEELDDMSAEDKQALKDLGAAVIQMRVELNDLANAQDAVTQHNDVQNKDPKLSLKGLYFIAKKRWPF